MTRTIILALAAGAATATAAVPASAQHGRRNQHGRWNQRGWRTVGYARVDGRDSDRIALRGHIRERRIRVCAIYRPLNLRDFDIRYRNGGRQDVRTRAVLRPGTCTRAVDLRGRRRDIRNVRLRYAPIYRSSLRPYVQVQVR